MNMVVGTVVSKLGGTVVKAGTSAAELAVKTGIKTTKAAANTGIKLTKAAADDVVEATSKLGRTGITKLSKSSVKSKVLIGAGAGIVGGYAAGSLLGGAVDSKNSVPSTLSTDVDVFGADTTLPSDMYSSTSGSKTGDVSKSVLDSVYGAVGSVAGIPSGVATAYSESMGTLKVVAVAGVIITVMVGGMYAYQNYKGITKYSNTRKTTKYH